MVFPFITVIFFLFKPTVRADAYTTYVAKVSAIRGAATSTVKRVGFVKVLLYFVVETFFAFCMLTFVSVGCRHHAAFFTNMSIGDALASATRFMCSA